MAKEQGRKGFFERGAAFFEKLHYSIGTVALVGAAVFPEFAAPLAVFGAWEIAHGALWGWLKNRSSKKPKMATAPA
ncbi:MAG TPA: hypothetical protein VLE51_03060 [Candidatus Saccharimonadales bacterium]|nr:hypothetical protein [Candidatus Saccharimonadales bacterium]